MLESYYIVILVMCFWYFPNPMTIHQSNWSQIYSSYQENTYRKRPYYWGHRTTQNYFKMTKITHKNKKINSK